MGTAGMTAPEAALTKLVAMALLAAVPETHHALTPAVRTFHWMEDCGTEAQKLSGIRKPCFSHNL